jgi:hypothetical protein
MIENRIDFASISREARISQLPETVPGWVPPVLKRFWKFTRQMAKSFNKELATDREEEFAKAVAKSFKGQI